MTTDRGRGRSYGTGEVEGEPWTAWHCPEGECKGEIWYVKADAWTRKQWHIGQEPERSDWQVAADEAICPLCGSALVSVDGWPELEIGLSLFALRPTPAGGT